MTRSAGATAAAAAAAAATSTATPDLWLGIDLGTQSVKAAIVSRSGKVVASAQAPLSSHRDGARHEQRPVEWIDAAAVVIAESVSQLDESARASIRGLAICATSGTLATVDAAGVPVGPGIMYDDARGAEFLSEVLAADPAHWAGQGAAESASESASASAESASMLATTQQPLPPQPQPSWALAKLAWLARVGLPAGAVAVAHQGDVVAAAMTGGPVATDWSSALKSGYDLNERRWPSRVFAALGLSTDLLPSVVAPGSRIGAVDANWAQRTGVPAGTPVFAGATDGCAGQFGAGALGLGSWHSVVGTTLVVKGVTREPLSDDAAGVYSHLAPGGESWLPGGASSVGAGALSAFLPAGSDLVALTQQVRSMWATESLPIAYPLVSPGERFPISAPEFAGFLLPGTGDVAPLTALADLDPAEALTAIFVGVAAVERLCFEQLGVLGDDTPSGATAATAAAAAADPAAPAPAAPAPAIRRLSTSGGGAKNADWVRLRASMLGVPITRLTGAEGSLGMAALAAWGAQRDLPNAVGLPEIAEQMSAVLDVIEPDAALAAPLHAAYARFRRQVDASLAPPVHAVTAQQEDI